MADLQKRIEMMAHLLAAKENQIRAIQLEAELLLAEKDERIKELGAQLTAKAAPADNING